MLKDFVTATKIAIAQIVISIYWPPMLKLITDMTHATKSNLILQDNVGGISEIPEDDLTQRMRGQNSVNPDLKTLIKCFPLFSVLLAIGNPTIDLFSLDSEGKQQNHLIRFIQFLELKLFLFLAKLNAEQCKQHLNCPTGQHIGNTIYFNPQVQKLECSKHCRSTKST